MSRRPTESANANDAIFNVYMRHHSSKRATHMKLCTPQRNPSTGGREGLERTERSPKGHHPYSASRSFSGSRKRAEKQTMIIASHSGVPRQGNWEYECGEGSSRESSPPALTEASTDDSWSVSSLDASMDGNEVSGYLEMDDPITQLLHKNVWLPFGGGLCEDIRNGSEDADKLFEMYINVDECGES